MNLLPSAERLARLRLARTDGVGPVAFRQLMARHGSAAAVLSAERRAWAEAGAAEAEMAAVPLNDVTGSHPLSVFSVLS